MSNKVLTFFSEGVEHYINIDHSYSPNTIQALLDCLPLKVGIHCAKIAGSQIMWPVPFVQRTEKAIDVMTMPPGAFFYWPERQYLMLTYDELQAESAQINMLGQLEGDLDWLRKLAEDNRREQGQKLFTARLTADHHSNKPLQKVSSSAEDAMSRLRLARISCWQKEPESVQKLLDRKGLMIPFGPLSLAESEMRKLHELLWRLWNDQNQYSNVEKTTIAIFTLEAAITRVKGFCHMDSVGEVLSDGVECLVRKVEAVAVVLEELILYCGRIAAWLDLHICWWRMNEITLQSIQKNKDDS